jgi:hypothetical protein
MNYSLLGNFLSAFDAVILWLDDRIDIAFLIFSNLKIVFLKALHLSHRTSEKPECKGFSKNHLSPHPSLDLSPDLSRLS